MMYRCDFWHTNKQTKRKKLRLCFEWLGRVCTIIPKFLNSREERLNWCAEKSIVWNVKAFRRSVLNRFCNVKFLFQLNCKIVLSDLQEKSNYYCNILHVGRHPKQNETSTTFLALIGQAFAGIPKLDHFSTKLALNWFSKYLQPRVLFQKP